MEISMAKSRMGAGLKKNCKDAIYPSFHQREFCIDGLVAEPNEITYNAMESSEKGEELHGPFNSVAELMEALNA